MGVNYETLAAQLEALVDGIPYEVANLANASALLWQELPDLNWAGFYKMEDGALVLGPFQGKTACIRIPVGKGVCGTAVAEGKTQRVEDVHAFPGHIACDCASNSEIVVPIFCGGEISDRPVYPGGSAWPGTDRGNPGKNAGIHKISGGTLLHFSDKFGKIQINVWRFR